MTKRIQNLIKCLLLLLVLNCSESFAQLAMEGWNTMYAYSDLKNIMIGDKKIYAVSSGNLFSVDKELNSIDTYSKITGLSDGNISIANYDAETGYLVIVYSNMNIDLMKDNEVYNISDLKRSTISNKKVNNIIFKNGYAYLSCGFGIMIINLYKHEIGDTYAIGDNGSYINIVQTALSNDSIYALSDNYLYRASLKNTNLNNYNNWTKQALPEITHYAQDMVLFENKLNLFRGFWYIRENGQWNLNYQYANLAYVNKAHVYKDHMTLQSAINCLAVINKEYQLDTSFVNVGNDAVYDPNTNLIWCGSDSLKSIELNGEIHNTYSPNGPYANVVSFLKYDHGKLLSGYGNDYGASGVVQVLDNGEWHNLTRTNIGTDYDATNKFYSIWDAVLDPRDTKRMYVATWRSLWEFYDYKLVKQFTTDETPFESWSSDANIIFIESLLFDKNNVLWVLNNQSVDLMKAMDTNGNWHSLYYSSLYNKATTIPIIQSENGYKWIVCPRVGAGIFVQDDNNTPFNVNDDKSKFYSSFNLSDGSTFSPTYYYSIAEDHSHNIWIGTDIGPVVLKNISNIFNSNYTATRIKITREDDKQYADYLLGEEQINAIAVDGADRKWIGTNNSGLYLLSSDGQKTIKHFTTENSPLTSDCIKYLTINPTTGEVYIAASDAMFTYQSDAADGEDDLEDIHVYPNPVRPNYDGLITVKGLMEDTEVRITDMQGNVIVHGLSNGGMYTWDGNLASGARATTGVYFVFAATKDGQFKNVAKFAVIKR